MLLYKDVRVFVKTRWQPSSLEANWLASCGGAFRSERVGIEYFNDATNYYGHY